MSIQLNVTVPLKAVAELRRLLRNLPCSKAAAALLTDRHTDGGMPTEDASDLVIAVLEGIKALPFDITPADDASTVSFTATETSSAPPSPTLTVESRADWRSFTTIVRDLQNKDEKFEVNAWDTMENLLFQYGKRRNVPATQYVLQFNGRIYSVGMQVDMQKIGVKDGSVIYVYPQYSQYATAPGFVGGTYLPDAGLDHMPPKPTKASTDFDYCDIRSEVTVTEDGKDSNVEFTVRDLMNQLEKFTLSRYETLYELADRYAERTGLDARTLRFKFPSGSIHRIDVDDDPSLDDLGIEDGGVIVAMPDNINF